MTVRTGGILCPFFKAHSSRNLICEGVIPDTTCVTCFRSGDKLLKHEQIFCENLYKNCEIYRSIMREKYDGEED